MTATLDDLQELRRHLGANPGLPTSLLDWLDTAIRVRVAQKTRNRSAWHRERQDAFDVALQVWRAQCEQVANGYPTEIAEFRRDHPKPRLIDFYQSDLPADVCPFCGAPIEFLESETL